MLFDLEIFKNVFEFLFSRNILKRFSIFEFQEVSSLCEPWKKDISFFWKMVFFFFSNNIKAKGGRKLEINFGDGSKNQH